MQHKRANKRWTINEVLTLQREYELLELSVTDIAVRHERSADAIAFKLKSEGFIVELTDARGYHDFYSDMPPLIGMTTENKFSVYVDEAHSLQKDVQMEVQMEVRMTAMESCLERIQASLALLTLSKPDRLKLNR